MFRSLMSVFLYFCGFEPFAPLDRWCDFAKFWCGKKKLVAVNSVLIPSYRGVEVRRPEALRASVSRTTIFIMPTRASVCSTGGRLQMVKNSKRSVGKLKSYEH